MIPGEFVLWDRIFPFKQESLLRQRTVPTRKIIKPVCCLEGLWIAEYGWKYCIDERKLGITLSAGSSRSQGKFSRLSPIWESTQRVKLGYLYDLKISEIE
jgi:hypothetical protein